MIKTAIGRLRLAGILEGLSFLYLLYHSIVSKRIMGDDDAIMIPGMIHGGLFLIYCLALFFAWDVAQWSRKTTSKIFLSALLPFGPFVIEPWLRREDLRLQDRQQQPEAAES